MLENWVYEMESIVVAQTVVCVAMLHALLAPGYWVGILTCSISNEPERRFCFPDFTTYVLGHSQSCVYYLSKA